MFFLKIQWINGDPQNFTERTFNGHNSVFSGIKSTEIKNNYAFGTLECAFHIYRDSRSSTVYRVAPPCFYNSQQQTNQTLAPERGIMRKHFRKGQDATSPLEAGLKMC